MRKGARIQLVAAVPIILPVLAGLAYLRAGGAPQSYLIVNGGALLAAVVLSALTPPLAGLTLRRIAAGALLALLFVPLLTGPAVLDVTRWLPLGALRLHSGMLAAPALAVLAARDPDYAAPILLTAVLAAFLQPDAATGFAITCAAVGLHDVSKDWKVGVTAIIAFFASLVMAMRGELPPQPFVERVLSELLFAAPLAAAALAGALAASFFVILWSIPAARTVRYALAGSLFGFVLMALLSHYPTPLIGYGAAPILGFGLALWLARTGAQAPPQR